ncbi:MAG: esterase [Betaproteobacteria bacterium RIFCSPHIGHO2_12_FULL_69_13]|nr:MAG: esterase [Betaproteobacteria bacterium RIFCSPHIGHO2_12_FULL_69_13]OGA66938.1 MAG: esterase [Betaproteobacteria bacterium RIFCSPLOWO2_12_FULL_68_20]
MATILVAHGAWSAGWAWKKMRPLMRQRGHDLHTPTYTGIGERAHLASPEVNLETHITDVLNVLELEDLHDVVLIGHSYGGMVATGVADRAAGRLSQLVYLDAFVPRDGQSLLDLLPPDTASRMREVVKTTGDGWRVPPNPMPPDTPEADLAWAMPRRVMQPVKTFEERLRLTGAVEGLPRTYIYCTKTPPGDVFGQFARRAKSERGWRHFEIDSSHNPHITIPESFAALLDKIVGGR